MRIALSTMAASFAAIAIAPTLGAQAPANDECAGAVLVVNGTNGPFDQTGATDSSANTGAPTPTCATSSWDKDIWFLYISSCSGLATFATCSMTAGDTVMTVYDGTSGCGSLVTLACNDDACSLRSSVTVPVTVGTAYYIRLDSFGTSNILTNFQLDITCTPAITNDECTGALPLVYGLNAGLTNVGATPSAPAPLPCSSSGAAVNDAWWSYTATCTAPHTFSMCTSAMNDTVIEVLDGCSTLTSLACNDDSCGLRSRVTVALTAGTTYLVRAGGWNGAVGFFDIDVEAGAGNGTQSIHTVSTCAANLSLAVIGDLHIGSPVTVALGGATGQGFPIVAYDFNPPTPPPITLSPCGCTILDPSSTGFTWYFFGFTGMIPCNPLLNQVQFLVQGFELFIPVPVRPCVHAGFYLDASNIILVTIV